MVAWQQTISRHTGWQVALFTAVLIVLSVVTGLVISSAITAGPRDELAAAAGSAAQADQSMPSALAVYQHAVANLAAAERRHDWSSFARFRQQLDSHLTPETIKAIYAERSRLLGNLAAAEERRDQRALLAFRQQISTLCPSVQVKGAPAFCQ